MVVQWSSPTAVANTQSHAITPHTTVFMAP
uniref:Uncharacterized protein n=1 Tax=Arundo donax TaxID=35708 RepID=A0A0A9FXE9_ARUDO